MQIVSEKRNKIMIINYPLEIIRVIFVNGFNFINLQIGNCSDGYGQCSRVLCELVRVNSAGTLPTRMSVFRRETDDVRAIRRLGFFREESRNIHDGNSIPVHDELMETSFK